MVKSRRWKLRLNLISTKTYRNSHCRFLKPNIYPRLKVHVLYHFLKSYAHEVDRFFFLEFRRVDSLTYLWSKIVFADFNKHILRFNFQAASILKIFTDFSNVDHYL
jgi:hypothetical protein